MAFWKKSEDPWDIDPNKRKKAVAPQTEVTETEEAEAPAEAKEDAPACPWCGKEMIRGYLRSGKGGIFLRDDEPYWTGALGDMGGLPIAREGGMLAGLYASCWQCKSCRKLVADIPGERRPNYVWKNGKVVLPEEEGEETQ